jgi:transcriptional regulator with XRE-family HTH domain
VSSAWTTVAEVIPLGRRLRDHREQLGMSQAQAARELDVARTAYRLWELEAARPSSDRWRAISRWLGISVASLLLAEELTEVGETEEVERITRQLQQHGTNWDALGARESGSYFEQERATIRDQARLGAISPSESGLLNDLLERIQGAATSSPTTTWRPAEFRKDLVAGPEAVGEARAALAVTASGLPAPWMRSADELVSALFQDLAGAPADGAASTVAMHIEVGRQTLRVAASDRAFDDEDGAGWRFVMAHASRWGATGRQGARARWFELDLPEPGRGPGPDRHPSDAGTEHGPV